MGTTVKNLFAIASLAMFATAATAQSSSALSSVKPIGSKHIALERAGAPMDDENRLIGVPLLFLLGAVAVAGIVVTAVAVDDGEPVSQ